MSYSASAAIQIATQSASTVFYPLTDHNRDPFKIGYDTIEKANRMADGTMRKFVVARKKKVSVSWKDIPSGTLTPTNPASSQVSGLNFTVDGNKGGAWMKSFYETNLFTPVRVKLIHSKDDYNINAASGFYPSSANPVYEEFWAFITSFDYEVNKRFSLTDMVNVSLEFTEI
jgi:hypothetical protein